MRNPPGIHVCFRTGSPYEQHLRGPSFHVEPPAKVEFSNTSGSWIDCTAFGNPPPAIDWISIDGSLVEDVLAVRRVLKNGTLVLLPFGAAAYRQDIHNTVYRCVASNAVGKLISRDVQVRAGRFRRSSATFRAFT
ncbi:Down syndrome cell adhesion molecule-like protein Dscam2 [Polyplax serrata]|uniref:Down syndrome cell adhesion molecule-like protein Dscam2 n=1 Tax=Polyplax serrata TaxID=468196 RepID=A0AAN8S5C8_POLSC